LAAAIVAASLFAALSLPTPARAQAPAAPGATILVPVPLDSAWTYSNGTEFPGAKVSFAMAANGPDPGSQAITLSSDFTGGGAYCCAGRVLTDLDYGDVTAIKMQVKSANISEISARLVDGTGQTFQAKNIAVNGDGSWHELALDVGALAIGEHWGGAGDGKWHGPLTEFYLITSPESGPTKTPVISIADVNLVTAPGPTPTILKATVKPAAVPPGSAFKATFNFKSPPLTRDYTIFVHFARADGTGSWQADFDPSPATSHWSGPMSFTQNYFVPTSVGDGVYTITAGLYRHITASPGWVNYKLNAGAGATTTDNEHFDVRQIKIDHAAKKPPLDSDGPVTLNLKGYKMTFDEEFKALDVSSRGPGTRWIAHTPYGGDFGDAGFTDPGPDGPFSVKNGVLTIEAKKRADGHWQSGLLSTVDPKGNGFSQRFGYFEMRAQLPKGDGTWPAFWMDDTSMLKDPAHKVDQIEVDVLEQYGLYTQAMHTTMHWWRADHTHSAVSTTAYVHDMTDGFHNYGFLWTKQNVIWYFDGVEVFRQPTPPELETHSLYMMVNLALGGGWPIDKTPNPSDMLVKWVRAYAK
jgi:hypothetical protein